jgi:hypothetical protein
MAGCSPTIAAGARPDAPRGAVDHAADGEIALAVGARGACAAADAERGCAMSDDGDIREARRWRQDGWVAQVIKNEDDDGWAVAMTRVGDDEPALVGPWTMGRDKKNPKPLDHPAFMTLVKTATEVLLRHAQSRRAQLHKTLTFTDDRDRRLRVDFDVAEDDDDPHAMVTVTDVATDELVRRDRVSPSWKLTATTAQRFARGQD